MKNKVEHKQSNCCTIMLIPHSSAKVRNIRIPHRILLFIWLPLFCIAIIAVIFQIRIINPERAPEERNEYIHYTNQHILSVFKEFADLDLPFSFDETLFGSSSPSETYQSIIAFDALNVALYQKILSMQSLAYYAENLSSFFRYRPTGWPVDGRLIISGFGYRLSPSGEWRLERHNGINISVPVGSQVFATAYGVVTSAEWSLYGYGNFVVIEHKYGYSTLYAHNSSILVSVGDSVYRGQVIALSGNTGRSTRPQLYYEVVFNNIPQNPLNFLVRD